MVEDDDFERILADKQHKELMAVIGHLVTAIKVDGGKDVDLRRL